MPKNSRAKGARGELEFCDFLMRRGHSARRSQQYMGAPDEDAADVLTALDHLFYFDVKRTERLYPIEWLAKALSDRGQKQAHRTPVIAWKKNRGEWIAMLSFDDLLKLLRGHPRMNPSSSGAVDGEDIQRAREAAPPGQPVDPLNQAR